MVTLVVRELSETCGSSVVMTLTRLRGIFLPGIFSMPLCGGSSLCGGQRAKIFSNSTDAHSTHLASFTSLHVPRVQGTDRSVCPCSCSLSIRDDFSLCLAVCKLWSQRKHNFHTLLPHPTQGLLFILSIYRGNGWRKCGSRGFGRG